MRTLQALLFVVAALLPACSASPSAARTPGSTASAPSCASTWTQTAEWATALETEPSNNMRMASVPLLAVSTEPDLEVREVAFDVLVDSTGIRLDHDSPLSGQALDDALARYFRRISKLQDHREAVRPRVFMGVAPDAKWSVIADALHRLQRGGAESVVFGFERKDSMSPPRWAWMDLDVALAAHAAMSFDVETYPPTRHRWIPSLDDQYAILLRVLAPCPELAAIAKRNPGDLVAALGKLSGECRCQINQRRLRSVLWAAHPADRLTARLVGLATSAPGAHTILAPGEATWAEVAPKVIALPRHADATFVVRPAP